MPNVAANHALKAGLRFPVFRCDMAALRACLAGVAGIDAPQLLIVPIQLVFDLADELTPSITGLAFLTGWDVFLLGLDKAPSLVALNVLAGKVSENPVLILGAGGSNAGIIFSLCLHSAVCAATMQAFVLWDAYMSDAGKDKRRAKGGHARANALTPERRRQIAKKAAAARWGERMLKATHKGNFKEDFGIDVDCYVLDDDAKTAVISQRGMGAALGLGKSGSRLPRFVGGKAISRYVGPELREKLENPVIFQAQVGGPETLSQVHGYDVTILIDLCKAITQAEAEKRLLPHQNNVAMQARVIINSSAKSGIQNLVYKLAGYDATKQEVIAAFKFYVREEAREYEREFPEQLYEEWYRLYKVPRPGTNRPWKFKHLTVDQVYKPLAHSRGRILELTQVSRSSSRQRYKKLHQFLSEVGVKALRHHLGQLLGIARISDDKEEYERHFNKLFGVQADLFDC